MSEENTINGLNLGDVVESNKLFPELPTEELFGHEMKGVGLSYHLHSEETGMLTELKVWHKDFDPSEFEEEMA